MGKDEMKRNAVARLDRREFLKASGAGLGGALLTSVGAVNAAEERDLADDVCILYDAVKCIGCKMCESACKEYNHLPVEDPPPDDLTAKTWNLIFRRKDAGDEDLPFWNKQCMHCTNAACVAVCPTGALYYDPLGFVAVNEDICNGCGYCMESCPFGVPHLKDQNVVTGWAKTAKCTFCQEKTRSGAGGPSCAEACPTGALVWGRRGDLLAQAQTRVAELEEEGVEGVVLYGEKEAGGLHRLSILVAGPLDYDLPLDPHGPLTCSVVWQSIVQPLAGISFGVGILGVISAFFVARRHIRMEEVE